MTGRWSDLDRPPLSPDRLRRAVVDGQPWRELRVVDVTASTNADLARAARAGTAGGVVLLAEEQREGRGRLDRRWESPSRAAVLLSVLLRPALPPAALPLLPLLTGVAAVEAVRAVARAPAQLKWPNDVLVGDRKLGGILSERVDDAVVIGIGLNVSTRADELPVSTATSLALEGAGTDREPLVKELLRSLGRRYLAFVAAAGAPETILGAYREVCATIGRRVLLQLPSGVSVAGVVTAVDDTGMLVVRDDDGGERAWSAGDVVHVRAEG